MSWAANRETTRTEDAAYCLLGIFNVHMPLLYGEEDDAFLRLQEEIIRSTPDLSIFAWRLPEPILAHEPMLCGVMAPSPVAFQGSRDLVPDCQDPVEFSVTNIGVKIKGFRYTRQGYLLPINCYKKKESTKGSSLSPPLCIHIKKVGPQRFARVNPWHWMEQSDTNTSWSSPSNTELYLLKDLSSISSPGTPFIEASAVLSPRRLISLRWGDEMRVFDLWPHHSFDVDEKAFITLGGTMGDLATVNFTIFPPTYNPNRIYFPAFPAIFYALGWRYPEKGAGQFTLLNGQTYSGNTGKLDSNMPDWQHSNEHVVSLLSQYGIPRLESFIQRFPGSPTVVVVSMKRVILEDYVLSGHPFYRIEFSYQLMREEEVDETRPEFQDAGWNWR